MSDEKNPTNNDEINLVDLFVVLLRHRKLIIGITLLVLILSVAGYIFYPSYQYQKAQEAQKLEAHLRVAPWPGLKNLELDYDIQQMFNNTPNVLYALREAGYEELGYGGDNKIDLKDKDLTARALFIVQQRVILNQSIDGDTLPSSYRFFNVSSISEGAEVTFKNSNPEKAKDFLESLFYKTNRELTNHLMGQAESIISAYERLLEIESPSDSVQTAIAAGQLRYDTAKRLLDGQADAINMLGDIYVVQPSITLESFQRDFIKKAVILVFAALFLSIFLAFILNAVQNIKSDEESMKKIKEALKKKQ